MAILSRKTLFSLALGGLVSTTTAWAQEPAPAPGVSAGEVPAAVDPAADRPGVVHVSDCPPSDLFPGEGGSGASSGVHCPEYVPPHAGWNTPGRRPIHRSWVPYHTFFPASWTGTAPVPQQRAPHIYMPTDTTQLGFYYQHVPTWHAYSGMIPPVPRPSDWHYQYQEPLTESLQPLQHSQPTVVPEPIPDPVAPTETGLGRSAAFPDLAPID